MYITRALVIDKVSFLICQNKCMGMTSLRHLFLHIGGDLKDS